MFTKEKIQLHNVIGKLGGLKSVKVRGLITERQFKKSYQNLIKLYKIKKHIYEKSKSN